MAFSTSLPTSGWPFLRSGNGWTGQKRRLQYHVDQWRYCLLGSVTLVLSAPSFLLISVNCSWDALFWGEVLKLLPSWKHS
ncbi:hypothetical protein I7I50_11061 [Histoplasma capsulatum G186AR]|uniref:Uncharacterized protein n=1 Tax=Ajellomyces capsulatus TaxID=5037 RepID=A0A8H7Z8F1_AJECA|nr:hypothetical protein I7I52_02300 [Histoplasma capsulatum]QSS69686.1 hypothetical protein I7I50_11061 [Histoplasma capsulatum G186AR]